MDHRRRCTRGDTPLDALFVRSWPSLLHGRGVHAPHGSVDVPAVRFGFHRYALPPSRARVIASAKHPPRRTQYGSSFTLFRSKRIWFFFAVLIYG